MKKKSLVITFVVDNPQSWINPYADAFVAQLKKKHQVFLVKDPADVVTGDIAFFLSCETIVKKNILERNAHNLVVHESKLPKGKGWSPLTWQILEGKKRIAITLFEAAEKVDAGPIYLQKIMHFKGDELIDELREIQGRETIGLIGEFIEKYPHIKGKIQKGNSTYYPRRGAANSELDINKTIKEQFNLLRVVDNERYPAFFQYKGCIYTLKIHKIDKKH